MANLYIKPNKVQFQLPYSDGSGDRISVNFEANNEDVEIKAIDSISIHKTDLQWLIEVLQDVKRLHESKDEA